MRYELRDTGISSPFVVSQAEPIFPDLDTVFLLSPSYQEPIPIIQDDELPDSQPKFAFRPSCLPYLPLLVDLALEKILSDLSPKEKLERYHQSLLLMNICMVQQSVKKVPPVFECDNPVSLPCTLSMPGKLRSLYKDNIGPELLEKDESSPTALEIIDSDFEGVPCIYKPTRKRQRRKTNHYQKKSNKKY